SPKAAPKGTPLEITGIQFEFPDKRDLLLSLRRSLQDHPTTDLFILSEYTFQDPIPKEILDWCKTSKKHLIAGGTQPTNDTFFNTAFVVGPEGTIMLGDKAHTPLDHWLALMCVAMVMGGVLYFTFVGLKIKFDGRKKSA
ncbi:MAG: Apolipoprotein N-acyltransferase-like protein, partial [Verrucomicrobiales bacterium]|nr:Apolipoprotein N-acyltransferase-like protein [Verrucomicrobiales bacterium]